jgi:hypothetical protein
VIIKALIQPGDVLFFAEWQQMDVYDNPIGLLGFFGQCARSLMGKILIDLRFNFG